MKSGELYNCSPEATALIPDDPDALYFPRASVLMPYFMRGNRGLNQMRVWLPVR